MPDPIVAKELYDLHWGGVNCYPTWDQTPEGLEGRRYFRVDTADPEKVLTALNVPALWDAHPRTPPGVGLNVPIVQSINQMRNPEGAGFIVEVVYRPATPGTRNPDDDAEDFTAFIDFEPSADQETVRSDVLTGSPIKETTVQASRLEIIVTTYRTDYIAALSAHLAMLDKVNSNAVTFPAPRGMTTRYTAPARTLLAKPWRAEPVGRGLMKLTIPFGITEPDGWRYRWPREGEDGQVNQIDTNDIYKLTTYQTGALWI